MARKKKCNCPKPGLTAPFYMLTFADMMTLLLTFFVLLFSMSTIQVIKFQAQVGVMQGALGISKLYAHHPIQKEMPAPSVKRSIRPIAKSTVKPTTLQSMAEYKRDDLTAPVQSQENEEVKMVQALGSHGSFNITTGEEEVILTLPSYGIFSKGSARIDASSPEVRKAMSLYADLAMQIAKLPHYDIIFVGHTDGASFTAAPGGPQDHIELGFMRSVNMYDFFFSEYLRDKTRITFASQGDNVPIVSDARLDSERRKNRRVEVHLKRKK